MPIKNLIRTMFRLLLLLAVYIGKVSPTSISQYSLTEIDKNFLLKNISLNTSQLTDNAVLDYFYANQSDYDQENQNDNLLSMVDMNTAKGLLELAHKRNFNTNYTETDKTIARDGRKSDEAFYHVPFFIKKALDLMKQSIYSTRYRLQDTRDLRKEYSDDICYNIAIFYGSLMQLRVKMDNVYATMMKLPYNVKFIWFLGLYERCLAMNVDITYMVETMFKMRDKHKVFVYGESAEKGSG